MLNKNLNARGIGLLCLSFTAVGWAINWPGMKLLLREWPPLFGRGLAGVMAGVMLAGLALWRGESLRVPRPVIGRLCFAAFTNVFAWMGFSALSLVWLNVGEGALVVYTMPIWATLFAWPILRTRPTPRAIAALMLGIVGLVVLFSGKGIGGAGDGKLLGILTALAAAVPFALGTVLNKSPMPMPPVALTAWQVGLGCLPMVLIGLVFEHPNLHGLSLSGWSVLIYMTFISMGACYLTWFAALKRLPPGIASTAMLLVPLLGSIFAALALGEPLGLREALAILITLSGITLALLKS